MINDIKKNKKILIIIGVLLILTIGVTLAYFQGQIGAGATANVTVTTKTTDVLTFSKGNDISITATQANFGSGAGNRTGSTTATATLLANNDTNSASQTYNVYLFITKNIFVYTTGPVTNTPELLLTITDPSGNPVTSISGLTYTTVNGVSGFDITKKKGLIQIASNYSITSNSSSTATNQTWNITVTFVNLNSDQQKNASKKLTGEVIIQKETYEIQTYYWNSYVFGWGYYYSYPLGQKSTLSGDGWSDGMPPGLRNSFESFQNTNSFSTSPVYIKATDKHETCLYYNSHEFCLESNYWDTDATTTLSKLQTDMATAFAMSTNQINCVIFDNNNRVKCEYNEYMSIVRSNGNVSFCQDVDPYLCCTVNSGGSAGCYPD